MQNNKAIQVQNVYLKSIELEHTNPSMGPHEEIILIDLKNNSKTADRINIFLKESIINNAVSIEEYINAHITNDDAVLRKVETTILSYKELSEGGGISNLTFFFNQNIPPLKIQDVYRRYTVTNFYGEFTTYMVKNGVRTSNKDKKIKR